MFIEYFVNFYISRSFVFFFRFFFSAETKIFIADRLYPFWMMSYSGGLRKIRVCVIGAGAAGLCAAKHLANDTRNFEFMVYEKASDVGGTWIYDERTGLDDDGYPIHSGMYANLRTNFPLKLMNFPDYRTLGQNSDASCGNHRDVLNYLRDYTDHFKLRQYIKFNTRVDCVRAVMNEDYWKTTRWYVRMTNIKTKIIEEREYDAIMVCNGHYFEPNIPKIPGIETFPGSVIHSHDYRRPEIYTRKRVILLGAGISGIDISIELVGLASQIYLSHNRDRLIEPLPCNMIQVAGVERIDGKKFILRDGKIIEADSFIYCTGYNHSFPFLDDNCLIRVDENFVSPLYKHLINVHYPSMSIVGIPDSVIPFPMFDMQVRFHLAVLNGRVILPSIDEMLEESLCLSSVKRHAHVLEDRQFDYNDNLARFGGIARLPAYYKNGYTAWQAVRAGNLLNYKNSKFVITSNDVNVEIIPQNSEASSTMYRIPYHP